MREAAMRWLVETWPVAATLAIAIVGERVHATRRRIALNSALHELRRPLQVLALTAPKASALEMTWVALADLDRQINGGATSFHPRLVSCREALEAAAERWTDAAALVDGEIRLHAHAAPLLILADPMRLAQALDNLIANALEHGGPNVSVDVGQVAQRVRVTVAGRDPRGLDAVVQPLDLGALRDRFGGRNRRGHGLRVVAAIAARHGGRLLLTRSAERTAAVLELPLAGAGTAIAA